ncbi:MAG: hypothetical protein EOP55_14605 [Sphingobacteriales bacterium]|nr:MAG: hypothetical protein EOP55_14605 [Sphingobacteriales bacterium]
MTNKSTAHNIGLAIWRMKCFYETFVQGSTAVILLNFCAKNPPHRQAENRQAVKKLFFYSKNTKNRIHKKHYKRFKTTLFLGNQLLLVILKA